MHKQTSVTNHSQNHNSGTSQKVQDIVSSLFQKETNGLTNGELVRNYDLYVHTLPAFTADEKATISATHQSLKGARNELCKKGIIQYVGERTCGASGRLVEFYRYVGVKKSKIERLNEEIKNRQVSIDWNVKKIAEAKAKIATLEAKSEKP